jgi:hypothetical protein
VTPGCGSGEYHMVVYAVVFGYYDPEEVVALYTREADAVEHATRVDMFQVQPMEVYSELQPEGF